MPKRAVAVLCLICLPMLFLGCGGGGGGAVSTPRSITMSPLNPTVAAGTTYTFTATVVGVTNTAVTWSVQEGSAGGSINSQGVYECNVPGVYHVLAVSQADNSLTTSTTVTVAGGNVSGGIQ